MPETSKSQSWFLHVDLDAFFASVEELDHPEYRGKAIIVGGKPEDRRSVVSTASYEARKFGVHSAMPSITAYRLCPQGIFLYPRMERYEELSYRIMQIFRDYSPDVEQMSIDEAFIDITGTEKLFGPPRELAFKIKKRVKEETGLTVSIGLARTKYLAKLASGYKKPDGFFLVSPMEEKNFMLRLPLSKVWGIGEKSLKLLNQGGIFTTADILERDFETLEFQFGKNTASFLYDIMNRGGEEVFSGQRKSHSISAERTFSFDLTDSYTAETALMELSHQVFFRLLREESYSRTVMVKIRYNDFKTLTVRKTFDSPVLTLDSFFEAVRDLFESKYDKASGIRLLGTGFENVSRDEKPLQQKLFDDGSEKKQAVEKAILKLEKKHPEIKIQKARTLKSLLLFFLLLFSKENLKGSFLNAQSLTSVKESGAGTTLPDVFPAEVINKNPDSLYSWDLSDTSHVDFSLTGWWQGLFESSLLWSFGGSDDESSDSSATSFSPGVPVFKQAVDLRALVNLNDSWFFEAKFSDVFKKNTYSITYKGRGYLREARLSNRNITMLSDYSADFFGYGLKGGQNQAPGLSLHFEDFLDQRWAADFMLRYDMTKTKDATYYGMNSASDLTIASQNYMAGSRFVFPESASSSLAGIKDIYVENKNGSYRDQYKKKYKKLSSSDYLIIESKSMILLASSANSTKSDGKEPSVLLTFHSDSDLTSLVGESGKYSDSSSFLGKIEVLFNSHSQKKISLEKYAGADGPLTGEIEGRKALVIQSSGLFSPYACASYYDLGLSKEADVFLKNKGSEKESEDYTIEQVAEEYSNIRDDFFTENHYYARVSQLSENSKSLQLAENRFPLADQNPEVYLHLESACPLEIIVRTYSPVSEFLIGNSASEGSVQVYKNGILDTGAKYYSDTGKVELSSSVGASDKIYIIWQEDSSNFTGGRLSSAAGFLYNFTENFHTDLALTSSWPLSFDEKYSTQSNIKAGFAALTGGISYDQKDIKITEQISASLNSQNASGSLLVLEEENKVPEYYYLSSSSGYSTKAEPLLNWSGAVSGSESELLQKNNGTIIRHGGESDSSLNGYKIPLAWDFSSIEGEAWAALDIKLAGGSLLCKSSALTVKIKPDFTLSDSKSYEAYLQLGVKAESSFTGEDLNSVCTWKITDADGISDSKTEKLLDLTKKSWQEVKISISDEDRAKLSSSRDARLIIVQTDSGKSSFEDSGKIYFGAYKPYVQSIFSSADENIFLSSTSEKTSSPSTQSLKKQNNYSAIVNWKVTDKNSLENNIKNTEDSEKITVISYFEEADFSSYGEINFDFKLFSEKEEEISDTSGLPSDSAVFTFILDNSAKNAASEGKTGIKLEIYNPSLIYSKSRDWKSLSINLSEKKVYINGNELSEEDYALSVSSKNIPTRLKIAFSLLNEEEMITDGCFYADNLYYSEASLNLTARNHTKIQLKKDGDILAKYNSDGEKSLSLVKNAAFTVESQQTGSRAVKNAPYDAKKSASITSSAEGKITLAGIDFSADASIASSTQDSDSSIFKNGGHCIKSDSESQTFVFFEENYRFNHDDKSLKKANSLSLDFSKFSFPLKLFYETKAQNSYSTQSQKQIFNLTARPGLFEFSQDINYSQKINTKKNTSKTFNTNNYFEGWLQVSEFEFSQGEDYAIYRNEKYSSKAAINLPLASLKPALSWNIQGQASSSSELLFTDSQGFIFELPFQIQKNRFKFKAEKYSCAESSLSGIEGNYYSDTKKTFESQNERSYFYTTIPFYDFFQQDLDDKVWNQMNEDNQKVSYSTKYQASWSRPLFNTPEDIYIPSFASLAMSRDISISTSKSDVYQFKTSLTSNAINSFGKESIKPLFLWYNQDEIMTSLTGILKIPSDRPENLTYIIAAYTQILFYINRHNSLQTGLDFSLETNLNYSGKSTLIWQHSGKTSLITEIAKLFSKKVRESDFNITRKETLNFSISSDSSVKKQNYSYNHSLEAKILKNFTLTGGLGGEFKHTSTSADTLSLTASIGGKAEF